MNRFTIALVALTMALSMLVSFSVQAGGGHGYHGKHHRHSHKHQRHYANHHRHPQAGIHHYRYRESRRHRHVSYAQPYAAPGLELGAYYGPSGVEAVIVYRDRPGYW